MDAGQTSVVKRSSGTAMLINGIVVDPNATAPSSGQVLVYSAGLIAFVPGAPATMTGAGSSTNGAAGIVPQPVAGQQALFLRGDGTWAAAGAGSVTLPQAYANGAAGPQVLALDSTRLGILVKDNATPISGTLFGVQSSTGTKFLDVSAAATIEIRSGVADGASAVGLKIDNANHFSTGGDANVGFFDAGTLYGQINWMPGNGLQLSSHAASPNYLQLAGNTNGLTLKDGGGYGLATDGTQVVMYGNWHSNNDGVGGNTIGTSSSRWGQVWAMAHCGAQQSPTLAGTMTLDPTAGETIRVALGATALGTVTISAGQPSQLLTVELIQDATGGRTYPLTWTNVAFAGGTAVAGASTANFRDVYTFRYDTTATKWVELSRSLAVR